jgi:hypothetical protein
MAQIPVPSLKPILTALLISIFVLIFRWLGNSNQHERCMECVE